MANAPAPTIKYFATSERVSGDAPQMMISTPAPDREGDCVIAEGGDFKNFLKNPVLCWVHDYKNLPIGRVTSIEVKPGKGVVATWVWLQNDEQADRIKNAYEQGVVNASSIGFIPLESTPNGKGHDITKWEMLELTLCPIPMNPEAVRAFKSLGLIAEVETKAAELSDNERRTRLEAAVIARFGPNDPSSNCWIYLIDTYESYLVFRDKNGKYRRIAYTIGSDGTVNLTGDSIEVVVEYVPLDGSAPAGDATVDQNAALDEPLIPMDDDTKYPFVSATGLTGEEKIALVKGINDAFAARVKSLPITLSLSDDDDLVLDLTDEPRLSLDIKDVDDLLDVDPAALRAALTDIVQTSLRSEITTALQTAVDKARGRVVV